jgi:hypothetical protein
MPRGDVSWLGAVAKGAAGPEAEPTWWDRFLDIVARDHPTQLQTIPILGNMIQGAGDLAGIAGTLGEGFNENVTQNLAGNAVRSLPWNQWGGMESESAKSIMRGQSGTDYWKDNVVPNMPLGGFGQFVGETLFDPTTYMGFGLAGKAAKLVGQTGKLGKALTVADKIDTGVSEAGNALTGLAGKGLKTASKKIPGDPLGASKRSQITEYADNLKRGMRELEALGGPSALRTGKEGILERFSDELEGLRADPDLKKKILEENTARTQEVNDYLASISDPALRAQLEALDKARRAVSVGWVTKEGDELPELNDYLAGHSLLKDFLERIKTITPDASRMADSEFDQMKNGLLGDMDRVIPHTEKKQALDALWGATQHYFGNPTQHPELGKLHEELSELLLGDSKAKRLMSPGAYKIIEDNLPFFTRKLGSQEKKVKKLQKTYDMIVNEIPASTRQALEASGTPLRTYDSFKTLDEIYNYLHPLASDEGKNTLRSIKDSWAKTGLDIDDPVSPLLKSATTVLIKNFAESLVPAGTKNRNAVIQQALDAYLTANRAWAEQTLALSPRYYLQNALSQYVFNGLHGVDPLKTAKFQFQNAEHLMKHRTMEGAKLPPEIQTLVDQLELGTVPEAIQSTFFGWMDDALDNRSAASHIPAGVRGLMGAGLGAGNLIGGDPLGGIESALGGVLGLLAPKLVDAGKSTGSALEFGARGAAWVKDIEEKLKGKAVPEMLTQLQGLLSQPQAAIKGSWKETKAWSPEYLKAKTIFTHPVYEKGTGTLDEITDFLTQLGELNPEGIKPVQSLMGDLEGYDPDLVDAVRGALDDFRNHDIHTAKIKPYQDQIEFQKQAAMLLEQLKKDVPGVFDSISGPQGIRPEQVMEVVENVSKALEGYAQRPGSLVENAKKVADETFLNFPAGNKMAQEYVPGGTTARYGQSVIDNLSRIFEETGGKLGPTQLHALLLNQGVDPETATAARKVWAGIIDQTNTGAADFASKIHFDYRKTDNLEEWLRNTAFPFAIWPKRALPLFAQLAASHPGALSAVYRYNNLAEDERAKVPARFGGMIEGGNLGSQILSGLLGEPGKAMIDPMGALLPFASGSEPIDTENPLAAVVGAAQNFGFGPNPILGTLLGLTQADQNFPRLLKQNALLQTITGRDPERHIKDSLGAVANTLPKTLTKGTKMSSDEWLDFLIKRQMQGNFASNTGQAAPQIDQIQQVPGYDQVRGDVLKNQRITNLLNQVSPVYTKFMPAIEEEANLQRQQLNQQTPWDFGAYTRTGEEKKQTQDVWQAALKELPLAETYGKAIGPNIHPVEILTAAKNIARGGKNPTKGDTDTLAWRYLYWLKDQGFNVDNGQLGDQNLVREFLSELNVRDNR